MIAVPICPTVSKIDADPLAGSLAGSESSMATVREDRKLALYGNTCLCQCQPAWISHTQPSR